jgi:CHAT domain-containing protein
MGRSDTDNLDEGILTAFETGQLKLSNTKLVILSACETGLGKAYDGEGIFGLQRSFFIAGASSVLMSLWKIDDSVTAEYITLLYKYWSETSDLQKSIDQARASIREKYKHPYYWGALKLIKY